MCCAVRPASRSTSATTRAATGTARSVRARVAQRWLEARQADLLPVEYYHVVFTLPAPISALAWHEQGVGLSALFEVAAETLLTIAADPKHLGATIGATLVLHVGLGDDAPPSRTPHRPQWRPVGRRAALDCLPAWLLPAGPRALAAVPAAFLEELAKAHHAGVLRFFGEFAPLAMAAFLRWLAPARTSEWVVWRQTALRRPRAVLACRATPIGWRSRTVAWCRSTPAASFRWKDYRAKGPAPQDDDAHCRGVHAPLPVAVAVRPSTASGTTDCSPTRLPRTAAAPSAMRAGLLMLVATPPDDPRAIAVEPAAALSTTPTAGFVCRCCGSVMRVIETFARVRRSGPPLP